KSHETFQCQPITFQINFFGSDQIHTPQYPEIHSSSSETSYEVFQANHYIQNEESFDPCNEIAVLNSNQEKEEPPRESDICQLIREECCIEKMEDTMLELVKICQEKEFLCIHDDVDNLIESALNSKLLLINSNYQHLDKKEQEVKNVVEQPAERGNRSIQSLQNFKVVHKSSISFKNTSQIYSIHTIAPIQSTKEPEYLLIMGYEHLSITTETESDEVTESNSENLLPIPSKCEVTLEDEIECDMHAKDVCSPVFTTFSNHLFKDNDDLDSSDDESLPDEDVPAEEFKIYSNPLCDEDKISSDKLDLHCFNVESDFVESLLNQIPKSEFDFEEEICLIENLLYDNSFPRPPKELYAEIADTIIDSIPLPIPVQDGNSQQEEIDIVTETDDVLPSSIENFTDDPEGDIRFLEELLINDSIISEELSDDNFEENPLIPRPPPKPPDVETDVG
nr:hypothetical protein [Tanacetum cinerariifolium]